MDSYTEIFSDKQRIMFVFSHPDDTEIFCGGIIPKLLKDGKEVFTVKMTNGNRGSRQEKISTEDLTKTRLEEDQNAAKVMGVKSENNIHLNLEDGGVEESIGNIEKVVRLIRKHKPDLLVTHNPEHVIIHFAEGENWVNHRDHMNTGKIVTYAAYPYSRDLSFFPEHFEDKEMASHTVTDFLYIDYWGHEDTVMFDITEFMDTKIKALMAHSSQYSKEKASGLIDFLTTGFVEGKNVEQFRYVKTD